MPDSPKQTLSRTIQNIGFRRDITAPELDSSRVRQGRGNSHEEYGAKVSPEINGASEQHLLPEADIVTCVSYLLESNGHLESDRSRLRGEKRRR